LPTAPPSPPAFPITQGVALCCYLPPLQGFKKFIIH
jgi:hypothetical protein